MNFSENWYTSSHRHKNNTGKVSWTSEVWFTRYEKVLNRQQTNRLPDQDHLIVTDENFSSGTKKSELNELSELEYSKTPSQMSSYAHWHAFLYLHAQTRIKTSIHSSDLKSEKKDWAKWARILKNTLTDEELYS